MADGRPAGLTLANWDLGGEPSAWAYLHAGELFASTEIRPRRRPAGLERAPQDVVADFPVRPGTSLDAYVASGPVSGMVVVLGGRIVFERYPRMEPGDRHLLMSVTKAFTSAVVGILEQRGLLDPGQPVDAVLPELSGPGWAGVTGQDVLDMASGIGCPEVDGEGAYTDPDHPFYRFEASLGWRPGPDTSTYSLVAGLPPGRPPGQVYEYTSVNTFVLSWLAERVTGRPFAEVLGREIWSAAGFEAPARLCVSAGGAPVSHGGLSVTLRDLARFGMLFTPSSRVIADAPVIAEDDVRRIRPRRDLHRDPAGDVPGYAVAAYGGALPPPGRQWDFVTDEGDLFKGGFGGQGLYVSPGRDLVVAFAGTPAGDGSVNQLRWFSRSLALSLRV
ncbi:MAG TPA: serine hydrolase domain-containing protein [Streptosporangiaceae bacterium]